MLNDYGPKFYNKNSSKQEIIQCGDKIFVKLYNGDENDTLKTLRYKMFAEKISKNKNALKPEELPPTSSAAKFHSMRAYFQVQSWLGNDSLKPEDWGWELIENMYQPISTDRAAAPMEILELIRCNCKAGCTTLKCSCKRHSLECSIACGQCRGVSCSNISINHEMDYED